MTTAARWYYNHLVRQHLFIKNLSLRQQPLQFLGLELRILKMLHVSRAVGLSTSLAILHSGVEVGNHHVAQIVEKTFATTLPERTNTFGHVTVIRQHYATKLEAHGVEGKALIYGSVRLLSLAVRRLMMQGGAGDRAVEVQHESASAARIVVRSRRLVLRSAVR